MTNLIKTATPLLMIVIFSACGGGGGGGGSSQQPSLDKELLSYTVENQAVAAKFLTRTTFGPTEKSINHLVNKETYISWLDEQFNTPATMHAPLVEALGKKMCVNLDREDGEFRDSWEYEYARHQVFWETALHANDQLRQRVAFALSQILVISDSEGLGLDSFQHAVASYYDVLVKHAFGNYRDLLKDVTLHPAMGDFLSMTRNQKSNVETGVRPDENYAREFLQLFTIGVHTLNLDGSKKLDSNGNTIPTYNQKTIEEFAKVFTGWNYAGATWTSYFGGADHNSPMVAMEEYHDTSEKILLNNTISPSGQSAQADLEFALDNVFEHPNMAPFISKQLIQRLVSSNPTPDYVERVANVFNDNGEGVKGDLKAVITAILLDDEALSENKPNDFGKLREPILRISHLWRVFNLQTSLKKGRRWNSEETCGQGNYPYYIFWNDTSDFKAKTDQNPLGANSVFNFFRPDFSPNGSLNEQGLVAPEFEIVNENTLNSTTNLLHLMLSSHFSDSKATEPTLDEKSTLNLEKEVTLANDTDKLLDHLSLVLLNNDMSPALREIIKEHLNLEDAYKNADNPELEKAREAILLVISSPEYLIQR